MIILPAIDLKAGQCVRLYKGDFATVEKVAENALETAVAFANQGATWLHMVDLDGALEGAPFNREVILQVVGETKLQVEVGGGIRDMNAVATYLSSGVKRVILGSAAVNDRAFVAEAVRNYGAQIAVGIDAKDQLVRAAGWLDHTEVHYLELAKQMEAIGVGCLIYTDISKDGTLTGPNLEQLVAINEAVSCEIIASGGITNLADIHALKQAGLYGAICGKSLYKGTLDLAEAIRAGL